MHSPLLLWTVANVEDPAGQPWIERTNALALAFSREVHGDDVGCHLIDLFFLQAAAALMWSTDGERMCWSRLDGKAWLARVRALPSWRDEWRDNAVMTLFAFYSFLAKHGHVTPEQAATVLEPLLPELHAAVRPFVWAAPAAAQRMVH